MAHVDVLRQLRGLSIVNLSSNEPQNHLENIRNQLGQVHAHVSRYCCECCGVAEPNRSSSSPEHHGRLIVKSPSYNSEYGMLCHRRAQSDDATVQNLTGSLRMSDASQIRNTETGGVPWHLLPPELLLRIFAWLEVNDRVHITTVCRLWYDLCTKDPLLWATSEILSIASFRAHESRFKASPLRIWFSGHFTPGNLISCVRICADRLHILSLDVPYNTGGTFSGQLYRIEMPQLRELYLLAKQPPSDVTLPVDWGSKYVPRLRRLDLAPISLAFHEGMVNHPLRCLQHCRIVTSTAVLGPVHRLFDILPVVETLQLTIGGGDRIGVPPRTLHTMVLEVQNSWNATNLSAAFATWTENAAASLLPRRATFVRAMELSVLYDLFTRKLTSAQMAGWSFQCIRATKGWGRSVSWCFPTGDSEDAAGVHLPTLLIQTHHTLKSIRAVLQPISASHHLSDLTELTADDVTLRGMISLRLVLPSLQSLTIILRPWRGSTGFSLAPPGEFEGCLELPNATLLTLHVVILSTQPAAPTVEDFARVVPLMFTPDPYFAPVHAVKLERVVVSIAAPIAERELEGIKKLTVAFERLGQARRETVGSATSDGGITCEVTKRRRTADEDEEPVLKDLNLREPRTFIPALFND